MPAPEICNGLDDDCNGVVDEGCVALNGCADGTREGFVDEQLFPAIAGCAGGFQVPGLVGAGFSCGSGAGDDSSNPSGAGCSANDLCGAGFHVCQSADEVAVLAGGCADITAEPGLFFATAQSGTGCGKCAMGTSTDFLCSQCACADDCLPTIDTVNDLFGCGTVGLPTVGCGVLDRFSDNFCAGLPAPWSCNTDCSEALSVVKPGPGGGGVLCCQGFK